MGMGSHDGSCVCVGYVYSKVSKNDVYQESRSDGKCKVRRARNRGGDHLLQIDTRVRDLTFRPHGTRRSEALCVLVKHNLALVFDELALLVHAVQLAPAAWRTLEDETGALETLAEGRARFPGVVMRDLARDVVEDVGLGDTVGRACTDPAEERTGTTEERAVERGQCAAGEGEGRGTVVREERVGVLQEGDHDQPVVDPHVRDEVEADHLGERARVAPVDERGEPDEDTEIADEDLPELVLGEQRSLGHKVVGALGVRLAGGVADEVHLPAEDDVASRADDGADGRVAECLPELSHDLLGNAATVDVFLGCVECGETEILAGLGHKHLILVDVACAGMVLRVCDTPRMVRDAETEETCV